MAIVMVAPAGVNEFIARSGTLYYVDASRNVSVLNNDVPGALAAGFLAPGSGAFSSPSFTGTIAVGGSTADLIGFYGATAVVQPAGASQATFVPSTLTSIATTVFSQAFTGMWAFSSSTVAKSFQTQINKLIVDVPKIETLLLKLRANLVTLGVIKGAA